MWSVSRVTLNWIWISFMANISTSGRVPTKMYILKYNCSTHSTCPVLYFCKRFIVICLTVMISFFFFFFFFFLFFVLLSVFYILETYARKYWFIYSKRGQWESSFPELNRKVMRLAHSGNKSTSKCHFSELTLSPRNGWWGGGGGTSLMKLLFWEALWHRSVLDNV